MWYHHPGSLCAVREEPPRREGTATPSHEKDQSEATAEADVKREQVERMEKIPEAQMLFETAPKPIPPSVTAEIAPQSPMSKEAAERILSYWAEREDDGEKDEKEATPPPDYEHEQGMAMEFEADSVLSAADYLAPDEARKGDNKNDDGGVE